MRSKETSTSVYFVRHGQTDFPTDRIYCDALEDPPLNSQGSLQAKSTTDFFKGMEIDALYASPTARTMATAKAIAERLEVPIRCMDVLQERDFGVWNGLFFDQIEAQFPDQYRQWKKDKVGYTPTGGETIVDVQVRVFNAIRSIIDNHQGQRVIIVSHVGPIRLWLTGAIEIPLAQYRQLTVDYASVSQVDYGERYNNLRFANRIYY